MEKDKHKTLYTKVVVVFLATLLLSSSAVLLLNAAPSEDTGDVTPAAASPNAIINDLKQQDQSIDWATLW
jgi:hypothetical protein